MTGEHYLLVVNAGNVAKAWAWIKSQAAAEGGDVALVNASARYALIAVQGPEAANIAQQLTTVDLAGIKYYWFATGEVASVRATISSRSWCQRPPRLREKHEREEHGIVHERIRLRDHDEDERKVRVDKESMAGKHVDPTPQRNEQDE